MACLRDILNLFSQNRNPFYAGFGNRLTDALSYRSVNIPSTRIFTINSNAEVSLDLLTLHTYKSSYVTMREVVDHFFPPVGLLVVARTSLISITGETHHQRSRILPIAMTTMIPAAKARNKVSEAKTKGVRGLTMTKTGRMNLQKATFRKSRMQREMTLLNRSGRLQRMAIRFRSHRMP